MALCIFLAICGFGLYIAKFLQRKNDVMQLRERMLEFSKQVSVFAEECHFDSQDKNISYLCPFIKLDESKKLIFCGNGKDSAAIFPYSKLLGYRLCESGHVRTENNGFESAVAGALIGNMIDKKYTTAGAVAGACSTRTEQIPVSDGVELLLQIEDVNSPLIVLSYVDADTDKGSEEYKRWRNMARNDEARLAIVMKQNRRNAASDGKIYHWQLKPGENIVPEGWDEGAENYARMQFGLPYDPEKIKEQDRGIGE